VANADVRYTDGFPADAAVGILRGDEDIEWVFELGVEVPTPRRRITCHTEQDLKAGTSGELVRFPVVRGSGRKRHSVIGAAVVPAQRLTEDLPAGSRVVLGFRLDEAYRLSVSAYLPASGDVLDDTLRFGHPAAVPEDDARATTGDRSAEPATECIPVAAGKEPGLEPEVAAADEMPSAAKTTPGSELLVAAAIVSDARIEEPVVETADKPDEQPAAVEADVESAAAEPDEQPAAADEVEQPATEEADEPPAAALVAASPEQPAAVVALHGSAADATDGQGSWDAAAIMPALEFAWVDARPFPPAESVPGCSRTDFRVARRRPGLSFAGRRRLSRLFVLAAAVACVVFALTAGFAALRGDSTGNSAAAAPATKPVVSRVVRHAPGPRIAAVKAKLRAAAAARGIPPEILYAIAYHESRWRQFDGGGHPLVSPDGGIGIMQVTSSGRYDVERLKTDIGYNIAAGADLLLAKLAVTPRIGKGSRDCYENWFYAVWAYNGWTPNNPYAYTIWDQVGSGHGDWWAGVPVTPVPRTWLVNGLGVAIPTPRPARWTSTAPSRLAQGSLTEAGDAD